MDSQEMSYEFIESQLNIRFDKEWDIVKFDEHPFYKAVSGRGLKGVDFLALDPLFGVVMIEVKNYTLQKTADVPENIFDVMKSKKEDSIRLIEIINAMYQRKFFFRILNRNRLRKWMPASWRFWSDVMYEIKRKNYFFIAVVDY